MNTIQIFNTETRTMETFENKNLDCCLQALENLGYEIESHHEHRLYLAHKGGAAQFVINAF